MNLTPERYDIVGVRMPVLRKIAIEIAKKDAISFLENPSSETYEEIMVHGLVIGYMKTDKSNKTDKLNKTEKSDKTDKSNKIDKTNKTDKSNKTQKPDKTDLNSVFYYTKRFIPYIDSWGICDTFCSNLKIAKKHQEEFWDFIQDYVDSENEFEARFAVVMMLFHFINDEYIICVLETLNRIDTNKCSGYYLKMGIAWALAECFIKYRDETEKYLENTTLANDTYNKTIQKIIESNRVDKETKKRIKLLKK